MDETTRSGLEAAAAEIEPELIFFFSQNHVAAEDVAVEIVDTPRPGLLLRLRGWPAPHGKVVDIFIGAEAQGESEDATGLLEQRADEEAAAEASAVELVLFHLVERLGTGELQRRWSEDPSGHLHVSLYG
jgi:hypothetical protein